MNKKRYEVAIYEKDKLNTLHEENEQLKSDLKESKKAHSRCDKLWWELHDEKEQLENENEQLKLDLKVANDGANLYKDINEALEKENEQLKSEINMLKTTIGRNEGYIDRLTNKGEWR